MVSLGRQGSTEQGRAGQGWGRVGQGRSEGRAEKSRSNQRRAEQRAESREQRAESRGQRAEGREQSWHGLVGKTTCSRRGVARPHSGVCVVWWWGWGGVERQSAVERRTEREGTHPFVGHEGDIRRVAIVNHPAVVHWQLARLVPAAEIARQPSPARCLRAQSKQRNVRPQ